MTSLRKHAHTLEISFSSNMQWENNQLRAWKILNKFGKYDNYDKGNDVLKIKKKKKEKNEQNKGYVFRGIEAKWKPVQSLTRLVLLLVRIRTGIPSNWGSTGWRKGRDSGSCRYKASRVGIRAWRSSSGLKTGTGSQKNKWETEEPLLCSIWERLAVKLNWLHHGALC